VSLGWIPLGSGWEMAKPGLSGNFKPGQGNWQFEGDLKIISPAAAGGLLKSTLRC